jgi:hypothetical protein
MAGCAERGDRYLAGHPRVGPQTLRTAKARRFALQFRFTCAAVRAYGQRLAQTLQATPMLLRLAPVFFLSIITPLIAEYLLGNVPMNWILLLPILALLYGSGAVLVRELARKNGRGWPTMATLALAYAVVEEAFATQSWFNPNFQGLRLLDYGYVESLGTSPSWIIFILILHAGWSICTPIALTEVIFTDRRLEPWLGTRGICVVGALFALSVALLMVHFIIKDQFVASPAQFSVSAIVAVALAVVAFVLFPRRPAATLVAKTPDMSQPFNWETAPRPWILGTIVFITGSAFFMIQELAPKLGTLTGQISTLTLSTGVDVFHIPLGAGVPSWLAAVVSLSMAIGVVGFIRWSARHFDWSDRHRYALACGAVLVYCWWGFVIEADLYGMAALPGRILLVVLAAALLVRTGLRLNNSQSRHHQRAVSRTQPDQ